MVTFTCQTTYMRAHVTVLLSVCLLVVSCIGKPEENPSNVIVSDRLSNQHVMAIAEDELGFIWVGTERGLNRYDSRQYHQYFHDNADSLSLPSNVISALYKDSSGRLWIGTESGPGIYNPETDAFIRVPVESGIRITSQIWENPDGEILFNMVEQLCRFDPATGTARTVIERFDPAQAFVNTCHLESNGNFWSVSNGHLRHYNGKTLELMQDVATGENYTYSKRMHDGVLALVSSQGLRYFDPGSEQFVQVPTLIESHPSFTGAHILLIYEIQDLAPLFFTDKGLFLYGEENGKQALLYEPNPAAFLNVPVSEITCTFRDSRFGLWVGTRDKGLLDIQGYGNNPFSANWRLSRQLEGESIVSLSSDAEGNLWSVSSSGHFYLSNPAKDVLLRLETAGIPQRDSQDSQNAKLLIDSRGRIWLVQNEKLFELIRKDDHLSILNRFPEIAHQVNCIAEDGLGNIWLGSSNANCLYLLEKGKQAFVPVLLETLPTLSFITSILPMEDGRLLIGLAFHAPLLLDPASQGTEDIPLWSDKKAPDVVMDMAEDQSGKVWIGTRHDGLFRFDPIEKKSSEMPGLSCREVVAVAADSEGNIWASTLDGLNRWNKNNGIIHSFGLSDGIGGSQFNLQAKARLSDGSLVFGGIHGVTAFNPESREESGLSRLVFEDLLVNGQTVAPGRYMEKALPYSPAVHLDWRDDFVTISYAAMDFGGKPVSNYQYRLAGFQKEWMDNGNRTEVSFSNLKPGKYTLEVRTVPSSDGGDFSYASLPIRITPAPWNSWWAWTLYTLAIIGLLYSFYAYRVRMIKEREAAKRAQLEKEQEKKLNEVNMSFFNNISHEFRTPLTLISGPVIQMEKGTATPQMFSTVKWNVARMMRLVNQLMDFGKLEQDALKLQVSEQDVIGLLKQTIGAFAFNIQEKGIHLNTTGLEGEFHCPVDADKLDKIISNLLSNAMKYTPAGGHVNIGFDVLGVPGEKKMLVTVADDGPKVPEESLQRIFERYYQVENHHNYGTGIGLYFAKRLAGLHHGDLTCRNLESDGLVFTLTLPAEDIYEVAEKAEMQAQKFPIFALSEADAPIEEVQVHDKTVMVVDDDPGIVNYLKMLLSPQYNVKSALNATAALEMVRSDMPDLIVSDVAMPGMDGYQFCKTIKDDSSLCHIPVILVTAKTTVAQQVEGLQQGADAYVTKPFDPEYLTALIDSQLKNRERLHRIFGKATTIEEVEEEAPALNPQDAAFMKKFYELMEAELSNDDINVDQFADKLFVSRSKFYYKVKALTGGSPNAFFKTYKLNRAKELLDSGQYLVSEVADMTGFSTPSVFGRNFKARFGMTPTEYLEKK